MQRSVQLPILHKSAKGGSSGSVWKLAHILFATRRANDQSVAGFQLEFFVPELDLLNPN
jgi:hypothetical protein